jgi:heat-inducible transcriptional repressor
VLTPPPAETDIRHIDLVRMGVDRVSVVFVTGGGMVHTRTVKLEDRLDDGELHAAADYLLRRFGGLTLRQLRERSATSGHAVAGGPAALALRLMRRSLGDAIDEAPVLVEGTFHLLDTPDLAERATLPSILAAFEERTQLSRLLTECGGAAGPRVLIGRAGLPEELRGCALVAASYRSGDRPVGALGILGPARMEYHRTIPMVDTMARVTSDMVTRLCA